MDNKKNIFSTKATTQTGAFNHKRGNLNVGEPGIDFISDSNNFYAQFFWKDIKYVSVQIIFKKYWRGIIVVLKNGDIKEIEFLTSNTKKLIQEISKYLDKDQIRRRKGVLERNKK